MPSASKKHETSKSQVATNSPDECVNMDTIASVCPIAVSGARTIQCEPKSSAEWPDKHALSPERVEDQVRIVSYNRFEEQHQTCPSSNQCSMDTVNTDETARIVQDDAMHPKPRDSHAMLLASIVQVLAVS